MEHLNSFSWRPTGWLLAAAGLAIPVAVAWTNFTTAGETSAAPGVSHKYDAAVTAWASEQLAPQQAANRLREPRPFSTPKADPLVRPASNLSINSRYESVRTPAVKPLMGDRYGSPAALPSALNAKPLAPLAEVKPLEPLPQRPAIQLAPPVVAPKLEVRQAKSDNPPPALNPLRPQPNLGLGPASTMRAKDAFAAAPPAYKEPLKMDLAAPPKPVIAPIQMAAGVAPLESAKPQAAGEPRPLAPMNDDNPLRIASATPASLPTPIVAPAPLMLPPRPAPQPLAAAPMPAMAEGRPGDQSLEGPQRPAILLEKLPPAAAQVGAVCKFITRVRNVGEQPAEDVRLVDLVPAGSRLVNTSPSADQSNGELVWSLGTLAPGEAREVELEVVPTAEGALGSVARVTYTAQASSRVRVTKPQLQISATAGNEVLVGRQHKVSIELTNAGSGDATNVMILENVPGNLKHEAGPALEFEIGTLRAGETRKLDLVLTAEQAGRVQNEIIARADGELEARQVVEFNVIAPALQVAVQGPAKRYLERPATYTVSIDNPGTAPARDVRLVTKLPKGLKFVSANNMGEYDPSTHAVYWSLAELPSGEHGAVELVAMPVEPGEHALKVQGVAREGLKVEQIQPLTVEGIAAIRFEVRDLADPIEVGGETVYEIRVTNQGSKSATNVKVLAQAPPGMRLVSAEGETQHRLTGAQLEFAPLEQLPPHGEVTYRVKAEGVQTGDQRMTVFVTTDDISQPIREEESTRVFGDE